MRHENDVDSNIGNQGTTFIYYKTGKYILTTLNWTNTRLLTRPFFQNKSLCSHNHSLSTNPQTHLFKVKLETFCLQHYATHFPSTAGRSSVHLLSRSFSKVPYSQLNLHTTLSVTFLFRLATIKSSTVNERCKEHSTIRTSDSVASIDPDFARKFRARPSQKETARRLAQARPGSNSFGNWIAGLGRRSPRATRPTDRPAPRPEADVAILSREIRLSRPSLPSSVNRASRVCPLDSVNRYPAPRARLGRPLEDEVLRVNPSRKLAAASEALIEFAARARAEPRRVCPGRPRKIAVGLALLSGRSSPAAANAVVPRLLIHHERNNDAWRGRWSVVRPWIRPNRIRSRLFIRGRWESGFGFVAGNWKNNLCQVPAGFRLFILEGNGVWRFG